MSKTTHHNDRNPSENFMSCYPWARYTRNGRITYLQTIHTSHGSFYSTETFNILENRIAIARRLRKARKMLHTRVGLKLAQIKAGLNV